MYQLFVKIDGYKYVLYNESDSLDYLKRGTNIFPNPWKIEKDGKIVAQSGPNQIQREWLSVRDSLPLGAWSVSHPWLSEEVLIANSCSINIGFYNRLSKTWYVDTLAKEEWIDKITHWMPLPVNPHDDKGR